MPLENLEEQGLEKNPNLEYAQWKFLLSLNEHKNDTTLQNRLLDAIKQDSKYLDFVEFIRFHFGNDISFGPKSAFLLNLSLLTFVYLCVLSPNLVYYA